MIEMLAEEPALLQDVLPAIAGSPDTITRSGSPPVCMSIVSIFSQPSGGSRCSERCVIFLCWQEQLCMRCLADAAVPQL
jgi:hypothetical protein